MCIVVQCHSMYTSCVVFFCGGRHTLSLLNTRCARILPKFSTLPHITTLCVLTHYVQLLLLSIHCVMLTSTFSQTHRLGQVQLTNFTFKCAVPPGTKYHRFKPHWALRRIMLLFLSKWGIHGIEIHTF